MELETSKQLYKRAMACHCQAHPSLEKCMCDVVNRYAVVMCTSHQSVSRLFRRIANVQVPQRIPDHVPLTNRSSRCIDQIALELWLWSYASGHLRLLCGGVSVCSRLTRLAPFRTLLCMRMRSVGDYPVAVLEPISERYHGLAIMDLAGSQPYGGRDVAPHCSVVVGRAP